MKAVRVQRPGVVALENVPTPEPGEAQVRIRTAYCAICATDLAMIAGWERTPYPATPGHEWSGVVDAVGIGVGTDLVGRRCVGDNIISCGACAACREARPDACAQTREVGFELPGGYAEYFLTKAANLRFLSDDVPLSSATLTEPLAVVMRALARLHERAPSGPVLIAGDGPIGLLTVLALRQEGVQQIALLGGRTHKLALGKAFGAATTCSYKTAEAERRDWLQSAAPEGFALAVEASGSPDAVVLLLNVVAKDGEVLLLGEYGEACAQVALTRTVLKELRLVASNSGTGAWDDAVGFLGRHHEMITRMVTHQFAPEDFEEALATVQHKRDECIKALLRWERS